MKTQKLKFQKSIFFLLILSFLLTTGMKCKKENNLDPDGLPKATQTGANVFACKVNGENWIAENDSYHLSAVFKHDTLNLKGALKSKFEDFYIKIFNTEIKEGVKYHLDDSQNSYAYYLTNQNCFSDVSGYGVGSAKSLDGQVIFTKVDNIKKILSGTFWFNIPTDKCGELKITNGRFDIRYY
ncbi:hypothetical protein I5M32_11865 [Pedobacter sp. SD-b]|uniref:Lipoprotein n=1 Tax=Pedobacter segetis TaxID=2793069 RepID=A0ABS1BL83_9SPHI|nr:DUF6252 family protein [Pedobacter segetis]MBK0383655.1 hypothetical protein [Pedobacter segetis]